MLRSVACRGLTRLNAPSANGAPEYTRGGCRCGVVPTAPAPLARCSSSPSSWAHGWRRRRSPRARSSRSASSTTTPGPLAGGGSELHALGAKIMIDHFIKKGGVEGYQIEALYADAQSKPEIAINEAVRLIEQEKVDMLLGFYSSAQCVPAAARVEQLKKFMWITTCISSAVLENRNLKYVFRIAAERPPVRPDVDRLHRPERQGQAGQGAQGSAGGDHPRGRRLRGRRVEGQRGGRQEGRLQHRAEGGLRGDGARPLAAGDQAQARPARRHLPHRLQPRHHACSCARRASWGCASARWSATAPATASTTS